MQLKIQRSQRMGGLTRSTVNFCLDIRADYTPEERESIRTYKIGGQLVYESRAARRHAERSRAHLALSTVESGAAQAASILRSAGSLALARTQLNVTIASLGRGHHIECKDLEEMMDAEAEIREACKDVSAYLAVAATFNGTEVLISYDKGQEVVELQQNAPPLLAYDPLPPEPGPAVVEGPYSGTGILQVLLQDLRAAEARVLAALDARGWIVTRTQVRGAAIVGGLLALYILHLIF